MAREYRANEIFKPGTYPEHTYVTRRSRTGTYDSLLEEALDTLGFLTSIVGPSKSGKTVLCENVIGSGKMILLSGGDFKEGEDFWTTIANKIGLPIETESTDANTDEVQGGVKGSAFFVEGQGSIKRSTTQSYKAKQFTGKDRVIEEFVSNELVLVLDDFHYINVDMQLDIAHQLKDAIRKELRAVVISLPHRADDAIRKNSDLNARMNFINIEPWSEEELKEIPLIGFRKLGVSIREEFAERLARESITSPQLMQSICLNLSRVLQVDKDPTVNEVGDASYLEAAYRKTTSHMDYRDVINKLESGPPSRGKQRKSFELQDGRIVDIYEAIVEAIAQDPPTIWIDIEGLKDRVTKIMKDDATKLENRKLKETLKQIQGIVSSHEELYRVLEWKDEKVYILDPYFLFYLRWGRE
ncbi:MAG TPA: ATP-binding protein [Bacilli bacterium]|nr:ATP-binding protein [Bacilli bacterium]